MREFVAFRRSAGTARQTFTVREHRRTGSCRNETAHDVTGRLNAHVARTVPTWRWLPMITWVRNLRRVGRFLSQSRANVTAHRRGRCTRRDLLVDGRRWYLPSMARGALRSHIAWGTTQYGRTPGMVYSSRSGCILRCAAGLGCRCTVCLRRQPHSMYRRRGVTANVQFHG
jgi:hypothetical protein